jgi:hypothetical protein
MPALDKIGHQEAAKPQRLQHGRSSLVERLSTHYFQEHGSSTSYFPQWRSDGQGSTGSHRGICR